MISSDEIRILKQWDYIEKLAASVGVRVSIDGSTYSVSYKDSERSIVDLCTLESFVEGIEFILGEDESC